MASKRREVVDLNKSISGYLKRVGVSKKARLAFRSKANSMVGLESHRSMWFRRFTAQLSQILRQIEQPRAEIDLNEPADLLDDKVEDDSHGKRKRLGSQRITSTPLRIPESKEGPSGRPAPNNVRPSHNHNSQVPIILLSDSD
ncbi:uncharacterized protein LOC114761382 [Neltuma alba]|uniref:uncharacterized protein LOC114761382 n=1 Tax=Neltuma alba TaxID=207710 RepID=UPI0010A2EA63|nr:uncharacterized protein LOC114761382 [Prosopis alba]